MGSKRAFEEEDFSLPNDNGVQIIESKCEILVQNEFSFNLVHTKASKSIIKIADIQMEIEYLEQKDNWYCSISFEPKQENIEKTFIQDNNHFGVSNGYLWKPKHFLTILEKTQLYKTSINDFLLFLELKFKFNSSQWKKEQNEKDLLLLVKEPITVKLQTKVIIFISFFVLFSNFFG